MGRWLVLGAVTGVVVAVAWWWVQGQTPAPVQAPSSAPTTEPSAPAHAPARAPEAALTTPVSWTMPNPTSPLPIVELTYPHFTIGYDDAHRTPRWARYDLDGPIQVTQAQPRRPTFRTEDRTAARVRHEDFTHSGWSRGHLVPAFALWSRAGEAGWRDTFTMTNVIPQDQRLNGGLWEDVEDDIAGRVHNGVVADDGYAGRLRGITVFAGPVLAAGHQRLDSGVPVPTAVFLVIYDRIEASGQYRAKAYLFPNGGELGVNKAAYVTTIDAIETVTDLDFMSGSAEDWIQVLESNVSRELWE